MSANTSGRLYLQKTDKQDVYVDFHTPLPQHQIDGIRFFYKQFIKKKPGVILNDPSGYGKCLQVVLFLNSIRCLLNKPIFVLCNEDSVNNWKEHFQKWTSFDNVAIETSSPFAKNMVYINTVNDAYKFCRRNWCIVIVHDNIFSIEKLEINFKADFKIWISSMDIKKDLYTFCLIHQWLFPKNKFNIDDFKAQKNSPKDIIEKAVLLDAFMEDFVVRRNDFVLPFHSKCQAIKIGSNEAPKKVTLKIKDPTGTKVKRSRKGKSSDDNEIISETNQNITAPKEIINVIDNPAFTTSNQRNNDEMDMESYVHSHVQYNGCKEFNTISQESEDSMTNTESTNNAFQVALNEIINNEN